MKIAYLVEVDVTLESGVSRKIKGQTNAWAKAGNTVKVFSFPSFGNLSSAEKNCFLDVETEIFLNPFAQKFKGQLKNYLNKIFSINAITNSLKRFNPDVIYYRQGIWFPGIERILSLLVPVVMEANTNDLEETKLESPLRRAVYLYGRSKILKHTAAVVSVTDEIGKLYHGLVPYVKTISNGYVFDEGDSIPNSIPVVKPNGRPSLVFVGMPGYSWHGVDKIPKLALLLPEVDFHLAGYDQAMLKTECPPNVICHGLLQKKQLQSLYSAVDIGIGTLALHRLKMEEACTLKVREYCAYGLPIILGHYDTDLHGKDFILNIGNYEGNVTDNYAEIRAFIGAWRGKRINRSVVEPLVGFDVKEKMRLALFQEMSDAYKYQHQ